MSQTYTEALEAIVYRLVHNPAVDPHTTSDILFGEETPPDKQAWSAACVLDFYRETPDVKGTPPTPEQIEQSAATRALAALTSTQTLKGTPFHTLDPLSLQLRALRAQEEKDTYRAGMQVEFRKREKRKKRK